MSSKGIDDEPKEDLVCIDQAHPLNSLMEIAKDFRSGGHWGASLQLIVDVKCLKQEIDLGM
jgi:hypothetical protein